MLNNDKNQYHQENRLFGYVIINAEGDVLDGMTDDGRLHFTPQYELTDLDAQPMLFRNRMRLPRNITDKLDSSFGLVEVRLDNDGKADADAVLQGRVIGSVSSLLAAAAMDKSFEDVKSYATRQDFREKNYRDKK